MSGLDERTSPWKSDWISIVMQFIVGIQTSIYYMSMWPYLSLIDRTATVEFLGWVVATCSLGCSIANPLFGYWNQKTMTMKAPVIVGMIMMTVGQAIFALLPLLNTNQKWTMMGARLLTGFGAGTLSVLRAYAATASVPRDRLRAVSLGTAGYVLGLSFGPAIQKPLLKLASSIRMVEGIAEAVFTPIGENGLKVGAIIFNIYTVPAFFMVILSMICCLVVQFMFREEYAGIIKDEDKQYNPFMVVPKFNVIPALICIYFWVVSCMVATNIEVISVPWSVAMYNWKDSDAVLYNGIFQKASCLVSSGNSVLIGYTRIGQIEKRKQIIFGVAVFLLFHVFNYPWWFYPGPLDYVPEGKNTTEIGGCLRSYDWCKSTVRVPLPIYLICFVFFFGISFPFTGSPSATLYSQILGPRKQGTMQGLHSFGGSISQFAAPILTTYLFKVSGYKYVMVVQICTLGFALLLTIVFYKRLVPLRLKPLPGKAAKYIIDRVFSK